MTDRRPDPTAPLGGAPVPWASLPMPSRRGEPPFHMTEMIEAEPHLARRILARLEADPAAAALAAALRAAAGEGRPILVTGCGTSEHAAMAVAAILTEALREAGFVAALGAGGTPTAVQAFEARLDPGFAADGAVVIGISHEGATGATNAALAVARDAGATVAAITAGTGSPVTGIAELVLDTAELDRSWCHTVGYVSPIVAAIALAGHVTGRAPDPEAVAGALEAGLALRVVSAVEAMAARLDGVTSVVTVGAGADRIAARELALKIEEGVHLPAFARDLETVLHGHLAGMDGRTGMVLLLADAGVDGAGAQRADRARGVLAAAAEIGIVAGVIGAAPLTARLGTRLGGVPVPAGTVSVPEPTGLSPAAAALLATAVPLQLLTERMARRRGVDPDPIRRDDPAYLAAADAAG